MRGKRRKIALLLAAAIILSSGTGIGIHTVPDKAATQAAENKSVEETLVYPIDEDNKDAQGVIYKLDDWNKTAKVTGQEILDEGEIRIPDQVEKEGIRYTVTEIGHRAFENCLLITSLTLSDTVEKFWFDSLDKNSCKKLFIGAGVRDIDCCNKHETNLYEIQVDEDNPYYIVDNKILYDISKTKVVKCPTRLSVSGTLHLPETVRIIGMNAFSYCQIESIDLSSVVYIDSEAFVSCKDLLFADLRNCRRMEQHVFDFCSPFYIRLRENLELTIQPFYTGTNATSLYLPAGVRQVEASGLISGSLKCFITGTDIVSTKDSWYDLEKAAILDGVTSVDQTIMKANQIEKLYIPPSVTEFTSGTGSDTSVTWKGTIYGSAGSAAEAFAKEKGKKFKVHEESDHVWHYGTYWEDDKIHYKGEICDICGTVKNVSVLYGDETEAPEPAKDLVYDLDENNKDSQGITYTLRPYLNVETLERATVGNGNEADACQVENVIIPDFVRKEGILYKVTDLYKNVLSDRVRTLTLGEWMESIDKEAFALASGLENIFVSDKNISYCEEDGVLYNKTKTQLIRFPSKITGCYRVPYPVNTIGSYAFRDSQLTDIVLPDHVTDINDHAFYGSRITSINLTGVACVGDYAFQKCLQLRWALFGNKLRETDCFIFDQCVRLEAVYMPYLESQDSYITRLCDGCFQLRMLHLPEGITSLQTATISSLSKLEYLYIPSSVRNIQLYDFDKEKLVLYGEKEAAVSTYASENVYQFSAIDDHEHSWEDYVLSAYEGRSLVGKRCASCGYVTDVHGMMDGVDWEELVKPTPKPTATVPAPTATATATVPVTEKPTSEPTATATATTPATEKPTSKPTATATATTPATEKPTSKPTATATATTPATEKPASKPTATATPTTTATPKTLISLTSNSTASVSPETKEVSPKKKTKKASITVKPVISVKKKQRDKIRYIQVNLKKYKGTYIQIYVKVGKKPFRIVSKRKIKIKKYKRKFRIKYVKRKQKIQIKVRTYYIKNKKRIYSRYSKVRRITT